MIISATGHRPPALGGYNRQTMDRINLLALRVIKSERPERVMSGMAQGWDQGIARACLLLKIPYEVAIPCIGQEDLWPVATQTEYRNLVAHAAKVHQVSRDPYRVGCLQKRNEYMNSWAKATGEGRIMALWNGHTGGTANCVHHAHSIELAVFNCFGMWMASATRPIQIFPKRWNTKQRGPLPEIVVAPDNSWLIRYQGRVLDQGSTSKHAYSLSAAHRNRERIVNEMLDGTPEYVAGVSTSQPLPPAYDPFEPGADGFPDTDDEIVVPMPELEGPGIFDPDSDAAFSMQTDPYGPQDDSVVPEEDDPWQ